MRAWAFADTRAGVSVPAESYAALCDALSRAGIVGDSAEVHGGLCASLCIDGIVGMRLWSDDWLADAAPGARDVPELRRCLIDLGQSSWLALCGTELAFELILPEDDAPLPLRVQALASWCHGFVEGIGLGGFAAAELAGTERDELDEIIDDFVEISRATVEGPASAEAGFELAELSEFVRVGAQTVFELLAPHRAQRAQQHLH